MDHHRGRSFVYLCVVAVGTLGCSTDPAKTEAYWLGKIAETEVISKSRGEKAAAALTSHMVGDPNGLANFKKYLAEQDAAIKLRKEYHAKLLELR